MNHWAKRVLAAAAPLLLTGCLFGPGKFNSELTLEKDGSFVLDYRGQIVLQVPPDELSDERWSQDKARCHQSGEVDLAPYAPVVTPSDGKPSAKVDPIRPCTPAEIAKAKKDYETASAGRAEQKRKSSEEMAKAFGLPGLDDESNRAFAAKLTKYAGWRSVQYRGSGLFDVDYHMEGRATQDFAFPMMPDNDLVVPFVAIRRRADGSVLVSAPSFTGGAGPLAARAGTAAASAAKGGPVSKAQGRFTVITDGEILTNNSEDGAAPHALGREVHWDVTASSTKIPETLIRLR